MTAVLSEARKWAGALAFSFALSGWAQTAPLHGKKLIEFGWDEPDTTFLRTHLQEIQQTPFDGCVFFVRYSKTDGTQGSFTSQAWGTQTFTEAELQGALTDLRQSHFGRFRENFLRLNTTPARLDWFDDYSAVLANAKLASHVARVGHCRGLLFDIEQYDGPLFNYRKQREAKTRSWEVYAAQVRRRGAEVMEAFQAGYPGLTVFLTFGYSLPWEQTMGGKVSLADCSYGLLAPFLGGMIEAAHGRTRIIDGHESSYGYKAASQFVEARKAMKQDLLPLVQDAEKYHRVVSLGFGLWMDFDWRKLGWDPAEPGKNYFTPQGFETSVRAALAQADDYVWIYTEKPWWWSPEGKPVSLPAAYDAALRRVQAKP